MNWWIGAYDDVKLVLQGDVERDGQIWKQCWFMTEDDKPLAKTPVALLREENKIVYIYPIVNSSTYWDRSGKYSWDHSQIGYCMMYYKDYVNEDRPDVNLSHGYPKESPEAINEVYPAVLYDFNMKTGDSLDPLASSHWSWLHHDIYKFDVGDIQYESNCSRTYKKINLTMHDIEEHTSSVISAIYEGIGLITYPDDGYYSHNPYFICPMPRFLEESGGGASETASYPELLYVTDKTGEVIFGSKKMPVSIGKTESENVKLQCADGMMTISSPGSDSYSLILYDMSGTALYSGSISADSPVSVSDKLLPGIYIAVAECGGSSCRLKFEVK